MYFKQKTKIKLIALEWGDTNFRAYAVDENNQARHKTKSHHNILRNKDVDYAKLLRKLLGKWINKYTTIPIFMSGVVTSAEAWQETDTLDCPCKLEDLVDHIDLVSNHRLDSDIYVLPSVQNTVNNYPITNSVRGKEILVYGAVKSDAKQYICCPGGQSHWFEVKDRAITNIKSFFTGEMFNAIAKQSQLTELTEVNHTSAEFFLEGVKIASESKSLLADLRTLYLIASIPNYDPYKAGSMLSGLTICHEFHQVMAMYPTMKQLTVIGLPWLTAQYKMTGEYLGIDVQEIKSDDAAVSGFGQLYDLKFANPTTSGTTKIEPVN